VSGLCGKNSTENIIGHALVKSSLINPFPGLSQSARDALLAIGPSWNDDIVGHRQMVIDIYSPVVLADGPDIDVTRDVAYGPDPRHRADVFRVPGGHSKPIAVFVHGGAFTRGVKSVNGAIYDNILYWFARRGFVGVNIEYRLAPVFPYPSGALDLDAAIRWLQEHAHKFGGDPNRLMLVGHSAGGSHVATYLLDPNVGLQPSSSVRGVVLLSARLRADAHPENPNAKNVAAYYGADESLYEARSPMTYASRCTVPLFVGIAEYENRFLDHYGVEFVRRVAEATGKMPRLVQCPYHNHTSLVAHFGTEDEALGIALLEFALRAGLRPELS
jgi:acetyl esterase